MSSKSDLLDEVSEAALKWAKEVLGWSIERADPSFLKIQALKAQAAALVGQLKARVDPGGMRGGKGDRVGDLLKKRIAEAKAEKPN
jgi:hypothetical protein